MKRILMEGRRFGRLRVLSLSNVQTGRFLRYTCLCDCGTIKDVLGTSLLQGHTKSCGRCNKPSLSEEELNAIARRFLLDNPLIIQDAKETKRIKRPRYQPYGPDSARLYRTWYNMKYRCTNPKDPHYKYYGALGITVCEEWQSFKNFYLWAINNGYDKSLTIDRIDPFGNYEPNNCRWADYVVQANNKRYQHNPNGDHKCDLIGRRSVVQLSTNGEYISTYSGPREAQRALGLSYHSEIVRCCQHKREQAHGFKWMYLEEYEEQERKKRKWQNPS